MSEEQEDKEEKKGPEESESESESDKVGMSRLFRAMKGTSPRPDTSAAKAWLPIPQPLLPIKPQRWEYATRPARWRLDVLELEGESLEAMGAEGWELVQLTESPEVGLVCFFKRPLLRTVTFTDLP